ncbi:MAG: kynureninase, partial [Pseudonocardiales bacterium]
VDSADSWQLSNPPIFAMAPVLASLEMFDAVGMAALRAKSRRLTAYLESALDAANIDSARIITPRDPERRGAQLSVRLSRIVAGTVSERLRHEHGVFADARQPDVVRLAPAPMYNTFHDCWRAATALAAVMAGHDG